MASARFVLPLLIGLVPAAQAIAQTEPTVAQAIAADSRVGSTFQAEGSTIFYQVAGHGTPLVLIHGYPLSGALFEHQLTGLASHFQVITLDLPGYGKSTPPSAQYGSTALYAHAVLALMDHLGIAKAIIGGHSMGGPITQEIYAEAPERFGGMILIDTVSMPASTAEKLEWAGYGLQIQQQGVPSILPMIVPDLLTGDTLLHHPAVGTAIEDIIAEGSVTGGIQGAETLALRPSYLSLLPTIAVPTLVLEGVDDGVYGFKVAQSIQAAIPHATLALLPGAGHVSIFEQPAEANAAILSWASSVGL